MKRLKADYVAFSDRQI